MCKNKSTATLLALIVLSLAALEIIVRITAPVLSENIRHIRQIPSILHGQTDTGDALTKSVIFMGNSLIGNAVDTTQFDKKINSQWNIRIKTNKVVPDGTNIWDWYCLSKTNQEFIKSNLSALVIGFAWDELKDYQSINPSRLAGHFCSLSDLPDLIHMGMNSPTTIIEYIIADASRLYSLREAIQKRILDKIIPDYKVYTQRLNLFNRTIPTDSILTQHHGDEYQLLSKLIMLYKEQNVDVVFIAMPVVDEYTIDAGLAQVIKKRGAFLYDYRGLEGLDKKMFIDPIHLGKEGSAVFSNRVSGDIYAIIK